MLRVIEKDDVVPGGVQPQVSELCDELVGNSIEGQTVIHAYIFPPLQSRWEGAL